MTKKVRRTSLLGIWAFTIVFMPNESQSGNEPRSKNEDASCLVCDFRMEAHAEDPGPSSVCEDLYEAACLRRNGEFKSSSSYNRLLNGSAQLIQKARNAAAKSRGFKDFDELLRTRFRDEGVPLADNISSDEFRRLKKEYNEGPNYVDAEKAFADPQTCRTELANLNNKSPANMETPAEISNFIDRANLLVDKYQRKTDRALAKDISSFFAAEIGRNCNSLARNPAIFPIALNEKAYSVCKNQLRLRAEAIRLFRLEDTKENRAKIERYVRDNRIPPLQSGSGTYGGTAQVVPDEMTKLRMSASAVQQRAYQQCTNLASAQTTAANVLIEKELSEINLNRITIESLIEATYSESRRELAFKIWSQVIQGMQTVMSRIVPDNEKRKKILEGFDGTRFHWLEKPAASFYTDRQGVQLLDEQQFTSLGIKSVEHNLFSTFSDPGLEFFRDPNAFYLPTISSGETRQNEVVTLQPALLPLLETNPYTVLLTLAHEAGHRTGLKLSKRNGFDLSAQYRKVFDCLSKSDSIKMNSKQTEEVTADLVGSEILALEISKLPRHRRREAVMSSVRLLCDFDEAEAKQGSGSTQLEHPAPMLRIGGIYGANSKLRAAMGCEGESPKYRTCSLDTESRIESGNQPANDSISSPKGVVK